MASGHDYESSSSSNEKNIKNGYIRMLKMLLRDTK